MLEIYRWWMQRSQYEERVHLAGLLTNNLSASDMTTKLRRQVLNVKLMFIMKDSAIGQSWLLFLTSCSPSGHGPEWNIITILNMQTNLGILVNLCYQSFGPTISSRKTSWYQCKKKRLHFKESWSFMSKSWFGCLEKIMCTINLGTFHCP